MVPIILIHTHTLHVKHLELRAWTNTDILVLKLYDESAQIQTLSEVQ